jgi:hypothetical protein
MADNLAMQRFQLKSKQKALEKELERVRAKLEKLGLATQN